MPQYGEAPPIINQPPQPMGGTGWLHYFLTDDNLEIFYFVIHMFSVSPLPNLLTLGVHETLPSVSSIFPRITIPFFYIYTFESV